jgi:selenoprotein W-related protein
LTEKILSAFKQDISHVKLIPSKGGCFEVSVNRKKIYSKLETGQFPNEQSLVNEIARRLDA